MLKFNFFFFQSLSYVRCAEVRWKMMIATLKKKVLEVLVLVLWEVFSSVEKNGSIWGWKPVTALAAAAQTRSSWKSTSAVLEPHKVPLSVQWKNWIHWSSTAANASGEFLRVNRRVNNSVTHHKPCACASAIRHFTLCLRRVTIKIRSQDSWRTHSISYYPWRWSGASDRYGPCCQACRPGWVVWQLDWQRP